jgi:hypothetical protein
MPRRNVTHQELVLKYHMKSLVFGHLAQVRINGLFKGTKLHCQMETAISTHLYIKNVLIKA